MGDDEYASLLEQTVKSGEGGMSDFYGHDAGKHDEIGGRADKYGNPEDYDGVPDAAFKGNRILVGNFDRTGECKFTEPRAVLEKKGFEVVEVAAEGGFLAKLDWCTIACVISGSTSDWQGCSEAEFLAACSAARTKGKGFWIWADNAPYIVQANSLLATWFHFTVQSSTNGGNQLTLADGKTIGVGKFRRHIITSGIVNLFEGITICYPNKGNDGRFISASKMEILANSTDGNPCVMFRDFSHEDDQEGRILLDCGWTKLCYNWDSAGTATYVTNGFAWLVGIEHWSLQKERKEQQRRDGESCRFGDRCSDAKCKFKHDSGMNRSGLRNTACKFADKCTKQDCPYRHPQKGGKGGNQTSKEQTPCKFGERCKDSSCRFQHPWDSSSSSWKDNGSWKDRCWNASGSQTLKEQTPCKFGERCKDSACRFLHPWDSSSSWKDNWSWKDSSWDASGSWKDSSWK